MGLTLLEITVLFDGIVGPTANAKIAFHLVLISKTRPSCLPKGQNGTCPCYLFAQGQLLLEKSMNGGIDWGNYMCNFT